MGDAALADQLVDFLGVLWVIVWMNELSAIARIGFKIGRLVAGNGFNIRADKFEWPVILQADYVKNSW